MIILPPEENACPAKICCCRKKKPRYCQPLRPQSFAPKRVYQKPCTAMEGNTVYQMSYGPQQCMMRSKGSPKPDNLTLSCGKMTGDTVYKLSYLPTCPAKLMPFRPCDHDLGGKGPMQDVTTYKHDYVPRPYLRRTPAKIRGNLCLSGKPLEDNTIYRLSYPAPEPQRIPASYAPTQSYTKPPGCMDCTTVYRMSYLPSQLARRVTPPWAMKKPYQPPTQPLAGETVYMMSYLPPGVECEDQEEECEEGCHCNEEN